MKLTLLTSLLPSLYPEDFSGIAGSPGNPEPTDTPPVLVACKHAFNSATLPPQPDRIKAAKLNKMAGCQRDNLQEMRLFMVDPWLMEIIQYS
ncbi:hypothetical protein [Limnohabitans sp. Rim8]|uniref:hypothetical protein n=1 Tax=Limnohabitans sp. Rim8 TaxID=1100718 RepID=UPI003305BE3F